MEIYKVEFKDKTSITVEADSVPEAINEANYVLLSNGINPAKVESVWSLVYMDQEIKMSYETGINIAITKLANDLDLTTLDKQELLSYIESLESKLDFVCDSCGIDIDEIEVD